MDHRVYNIYIYDVCIYIYTRHIYIWLLVKTRVPSYPKMAAYWVVIPQKCMVIIGFDPSPCINIDHCIYITIYIYYILYIVYIYNYIYSICLDKTI